MTDDRIVQRLEEQLSDTHATNADLRERLVTSSTRACSRRQRHLPIGVSGASQTRMVPDGR